MKRAPLPPMAPNQGLHAYPWFEPIADIIAAIKRHKPKKAKR